MILRPPISTRTYTLFPDPTLFRSRDSPTFKPEGAAEVRLAASAFISMRDRIKRQIGQRTDMLSGVSHDLRTPLTHMKLQLERSEEHTSELQSLMRISYAVFCLKKKKHKTHQTT